MTFSLHSSIVPVFSKRATCHGRAVAFGLRALWVPESLQKTRLHMNFVADSRASLRICMTWAVLHTAAGLACSSVAASLASPSAWVCASSAWKWAPSEMFMKWCFGKSKCKERLRHCVMSKDVTLRDVTRALLDKR